MLRFLFCLLIVFTVNSNNYWVSSKKLERKHDMQFSHHNCSALISKTIVSIQLLTCIYFYTGRLLCAGESPTLSFRRRRSKSWASTSGKSSLHWHATLSPTKVTKPDKLAVLHVTCHFWHLRILTELVNCICCYRFSSEHQRRIGVRGRPKKSGTELQGSDYDPERGTGGSSMSDEEDEETHASWLFLVFGAHGEENTATIIFAIRTNHLDNSR